MSTIETESDRMAPERMQCMEVWGGNCQADKAFRMPGLQAWIYSKPFGDSQSGGDVYYVSSCASGRITRLLLADVSGHGTEVADLAGGLRDLMRKNVNVVKQVRLVEGMNRQFAKLSELGAFATAIVATFFQPTRRLTVCNAGHPNPLHFDASTGTWSMVEQPIPDAFRVSGVPLGIDTQAAYPQVQLNLDQDDMFLCFSDALTESLDHRERMLGADGLLRTVAGIDATDSHDFVPRLLRAIAAQHPGNLQQDDLTILLCRASGTATGLRDNLLAPLRLLRSVRNNTKLE